MPDIIFKDLTPYLQDALKYIGSAAVGGVIGNRADTWFMSLFYHQRRRLVQWLEGWNPEIHDIQTLNEDEHLRLLFSKAVADISNEMSEEKLLLWPTITDSILRKTEIPFDKKQYFVSLFNRLDSFTVIYLATMYKEGEIAYDLVFNMEGPQPDADSNKHLFYLAQIQCATTGLVEFTRTQPLKLYLTAQGKEFLDFVSGESHQKIQSLARK